MNCSWLSTLLRVKLFPSKGEVMAKFCEECPDRGNCIGDIESMRVLSSSTQGTISADGRSAMISAEHGNPIGPTSTRVCYIDTEQGASGTITVHGNSGADAENKGFDYVDKVGRCTGPILKKFLGIVVKRECSAPQASSMTK
jgi:hypothetical protein